MNLSLSSCALLASARRMASATLATAMACSALAPAAHAQVPTAQLQPAASQIVFTTRQMGVPVEGSFGKFTAQIALDPKKPESGSVSFAIDTGSARFGSPELDGETPKPVWLNTPKFPQATFQSTAVKAAGPGKFEVAGKLAIKGSVRDVVVPVSIVQAGGSNPLSTAVGTFTIKRLEFKVGEAEWADTSMIANDVQVRFKLVLAGLGAL